jgi:hypothetical protein
MPARGESAYSRSAAAAVFSARTRTSVSYSYSKDPSALAARYIAEPGDIQTLTYTVWVSR